MEMNGCDALAIAPTRITPGKSVFQGIQISTTLIEQEMNEIATADERWSVGADLALHSAPTNNPCFLQVQPPQGPIRP